MKPEGERRLYNYMRGPVPPEISHAYLDLATERDNLRAERDSLRADLERERGAKRINDQGFAQVLAERDALREIVEALLGPGRFWEASGTRPSRPDDPN